MPKKFCYFILIVFISAGIGCATIIHGSKQNVAIVSEPRKASIYIDEKSVGVTPFLARVARNRTHFIRIEMEGFQTYETVLKRKLDGWIFGNILIGGIIGIAIDAASGSMYTLSPKDVTVQLNASSATNYSTKEGVYFSVTLKPDPAWQKIGQLEMRSQNEPAR